MRKFYNIVFGGIQQKVINLVLLIVFVMMVAFSGVTVYQIGRLSKLVSETNETQKETISSISETTMNTVISSSLNRTTQMEAYIADDLFKDLARTVQMLSDYAGIIFSSPENYPAHAYALPDASKDGEVSIQLLTEEGLDTTDPAVSSKIALAANLSEMMLSLYNSSNVDSCYIALPNGSMLLADNHPSSKFDEKGQQIPIPIRERAWYNGAKETGKLYYTDVSTDVFTGSIGIMCAIPVYCNGELAAVAGADLFLNNMAESINSLNGNGSFSFIVNQHGHVVFSPFTTGALSVKSDAEDLRLSNNDSLSSFISRALSSATNVASVDIDGATYYMTGYPIESVGWTIISAVDANSAQQPTLRMISLYDQTLNSAQESFNSGLRRSRTLILVLSLVIMVLGVIGAMSLSTRIVKPLGIMTRRVRTLGGNNLQFMMEDAYRTGDEVEVLAKSFATLSAKTLDYVEKIKHVTAEKERIGAELNMATAIQASQLPRLFPAFPTRTEFDIFASMTPAKEVGGDFYDFFLIDDDHIALVMADVSGKGVPAALFMMVSRVLIKSHLQNGESPSEALDNVNNQLCESNDAQLFVTVWLAVMEISTGKCVACNAGHEHPALRRAGGQFELVSYRHSPAVAAMEGIHFKQHDFQLYPGDSLFVYTDGVAEATNSNNELMGTDRMLAALNREPDAAPQTILCNVMDGITAFVDGAEQFDDITMLCLRYNGKA